MTDGKQMLARLEDSVKKLRGVQREIQDVAKQRETLTAQKTENELVLRELNLVAEDRPVYKMVGPVLVKQDIDEAKDTVQKRLDFIGKQLSERQKRLGELQTQAVTFQRLVCFCCIIAFYLFTDPGDPRCDDAPATAALNRFFLPPFFFLFLLNDNNHMYQIEECGATI